MDFELTRENYYSPEADREFFSCSQLQSFERCEAATMAHLDGYYEPPTSEALLVGSYFHAAMEGEEAFNDFCAKHTSDIFKTKNGTIITGKYAAFVTADKMIEAVKEDPLMSSLIEMPGENEKIMTGELFGQKWKIRLDKYIPEKRIIIDYKTCADVARTEYDAELGEKVTFVESLGYMMRAAVYSEIEKQYSGVENDANFIILAVSKQDPPDKAALRLNHRQRYDYELDKIEQKMVHFIDVKSKRIKPKRCGVCDYCRRTKKLTKIVPYYTLNPKFKEEKDEEYDDIFFGAESAK